MGAFATTNAQKCRSAHYADLTLACLYPFPAIFYSYSTAGITFSTKHLSAESIFKRYSQISFLFVFLFHLYLFYF